MSLSVFDIFKIGIGPSSSHTMGPMRAAREFLLTLEAEGRLESIEQLSVRLYGSLALTGLGHGTDRAILMGLTGADPETMRNALRSPVERIELSSETYEAMIHCRVGPATKSGEWMASPRGFEPRLPP